LAKKRQNEIQDYNQESDRSDYKDWWKCVVPLIKELWNSFISKGMVRFEFGIHNKSQLLVQNSCLTSDVIAYEVILNDSKNSFCFEKYKINSKSSCHLKIKTTKLKETKINMHSIKKVDKFVVFIVS